MRNKYLIVFMALCLTTAVMAQQPNLYPRPSQMAKVFQRVGTTDLEIEYHAPLANGREIFGDVVVYNEKMHGIPHPWRAGANENTIIRFNHDVQINGKPLKAGEYGLHIFVSERSWQLAFSTYSEGWGSFAYDANQDALRVSVTPEAVVYQDWLSYRFIVPKAHAATVELHWADQRITFDISTNVNANIIADVAGMEEENWSALLAAANSTMALKPQDIDAAMALVDQSMAMQNSMTGRMLKVKLLEKQGKKKEAERVKAKAIEEGNAQELFSYAMSLNNTGEIEEALRVLELNAKRHPDHWYSYMGLGNYYRTREDVKAIDYWKKAHELAPERGKAFAWYQYGYTKGKLDPSKSSPSGQ